MTPELNKIYVGDCLDIMKGWPDAFVQMVVTSPPYWGLRDYQVNGQIGLEESPQAFVEKMVEVFREVRRILRPDGTLWMNLGDSYYSGNHGDTNRRAGKNSLPSAADFDALPPNRRDIDGMKPKQLIGAPWRVALALQADGWYLRSDIIWHKPNPMPESVQDRPTKAHEYLFLFAKSERYYYDASAIFEKGSENKPWSESSNGGTKALLVRNDGKLGSLGKPASRKVPSGWDTGPGAHGSYHRNGRKSQDKQRGHGHRHAGFNDRWDQMERAEQCSSMRNKRSVWTVATFPFPEAHFATYPPDLIKPCVLAGSSPGDIVFDPFMGAGTTALVAVSYGRSFLGIEIKPEYVKIAEARIARERAQLKMAL